MECCAWITTHKSFYLQALEKKTYLHLAIINYTDIV